MSIKTILIPLAAFAVTVTGASAFNSEVLKNAGLSDDQIAAFEEARDLRESGDKDGARDVLVAAGIDEDVIKQVREAMREHRGEVRDAIEAGDYEAFKDAIEGSPLADLIDNETDFNKLVEAHDLLKSGDKEGAKDIFEELGLPERGHMMKDGDHKEPPFVSQLSDDEKEAFREAMKDGDFDAAKQILEDAGVDVPDEFPRKGNGRGFGHFMNDRGSDQ